ncbi:unnamed protein product [Lactuca virosa]|uniref:Uncharacterized protein n=1 Tax=Lactuca virosa TaxID=75947 RepID=A0AAU9M7H8_9ASTR|nr:unnamed protein product [Lactuca virosa]
MLLTECLKCKLMASSIFPINHAKVMLFNISLVQTRKLSGLLRCLGFRYKMSNGCRHSLSSETLPANMAIQLSKKQKIIANHIDALIDEGSESFSCYLHSYRD